MKHIKLILSALLLTVLSVLTATAGILEDSFAKISKIEGFTTEAFDVEEYGFPAKLGKGRLTVHANATPRNRMLEILETVPDKLKVVEQRDEDDYIQRYYFEPGDAKTKPTFMIVMVGSGGNDTMCMIFTGASNEIYTDFCNELKELEE